MALRTKVKPVPASAIAPIVSASEATALEPLIGPRRVLALKRLGGMAAPTPQISPDLEPLLPKDANRRFRVIANPTARALYFARPMLGQVIGELQDSFGRDWRQKADTGTRRTREANRYLGVSLTCTWCDDSVRRFGR